MTINKNNFWGNNYYHHPPLTDYMVSAAETMLGAKLPPLLIDLLKIQNGGYTQGFVYPVNLKTTWADDHVPLAELFGIVTDKTINTGQNILDSQYMIDEWGLPEKQVLLTGDGHWWITLDYRESDVPSVRWIDIECDQDMHIADTFEAFIQGLVFEGDHEMRS